MSSKITLCLLVLVKYAFVVSSYPVIPLNPRIHPKNVVSVFDVYVIISSSILSNPYSDGNPFVLGTVIVVSVVDISSVIVVTHTTTSGTKLSTFRYWSKLWR